MTSITPTPEPAPAPAAPAAEAGSKFDKFIGTLPPALRAHLKVQELLGQAHAAVMSQTAWGKAAPPEVRQAVGRYLSKHGLDPSHIDVLGGNLYRNHRFYLDALAPMQHAGKVVYAMYDHIEVDLRLDTLAKSTDDPETAEWAKKEKARRAKERIIHAIGEDAVSACVFRAKFRTDTGGETDEITGVGFVYDTKKGDGGYKDPVGMGAPGKTAESRAARRCLRNAIPSLPAADRQRMEAMDADFEVLETTTAGKIPADPGEDPNRPAAVSLGDGATFRAAGNRYEPVKHLTADEYAGPRPTPAPEPEPVVSPLDQARALVIPGDKEKWGGHGGMPFGEVPPTVLQALYRWADAKIQKAGTDGQEPEADWVTWKQGAVLVLREQHKIDDPNADLPF